MIDVTALSQALSAAMAGVQDLADVLQLPVLLTVVSLEDGGEGMVASAQPMPGQLPLFLGPDL